MGLKGYRGKRTFSETPEPPPKKPAPKKNGQLHFVVQKHAASHLHYDFRLEDKGVLLSWAIPKGPATDPSIKRLAIQVEDHPLEYRHFEGVIPAGNYGAGTVEIWDKGIYTIGDITDKKEIEKLMTKGLKKGHLEFTLHGKKLKGNFTLIKMKGQQKEKEWLFIKKGHDDSKEPSIDTPKGSKKGMPKQIKPMLATLISKPFNDDEWLFEIKWDGFRALAYLQQHKVQLFSRNDLSFNERFPSIAEQLQQFHGSAVLDGEIVALDKEGKSHFQDMQNYQRTGKGNIYYYVFDLLYLNGRDLRQEPLTVRKQLLKAYLKSNHKPNIRYSDHVVEEGVFFFEEAAKKELEGIIGKRGSSPYVSARSQEWVKIKHTQQQEVVIGGFTEPRGGRKKFGALIVGTYKERKLVYAGHVGGGFDGKLLESVYRQMEPLIQKTCPFETTPKPNTPVTWVKPKLVCEVTFHEWTSEGVMRQPIFLGMREDKAPSKVVKEVPKKISIKKNKTASAPSHKYQEDFSHLSKIYYPQQGYTKEDVIAYYESVANYILPYLKERPIVLRRFPEGIEGVSFVQKDLVNHPEWIKTFPIDHAGKTVHYLLINDLRSLLYAVNLGSIEIHTFNSIIKDLDYPTYCVLDLDPEDIPFEAVIQTAQTVHKILDKAKVNHFCKTSGATGLHIYIPLDAAYETEQSLQFAELIAYLTFKQLPAITSLERNPAKRQKKVYLDFGQNNHGQTLSAPYGLRAREGAPVSTPLEWKEVRKGLDPKKFTIKTIGKRLQQKHDLFKGVLGKGVNLKEILKRLEKLE